MTSIQSHKLEPPLFTLGYMRILLIHMAFGISYSTFLLLPKFLDQKLQANAAEIGMLTGAAVVAAAVLSPFIGFFAPRFDRRRLLGFALLSQGVAAFLFLLVTHVGVLAYALRLIQGVAFVLIFNCTATIVADQVAKTQMARAVGYLGMAMLLTNALAPGVVEPLAAAYGWGIAFSGSAALSLLALFLLPGLDAPSEVVESVRDPSVQPPSLLPVHYGSLLMGAGIGVLFTFVQPYALSLGATRVGDFFFGYVVAALFVRAVFGGVADRVGPSKVGGYALVLYGLVTIGAAFLTPSTLVLIGIGLGVSHGFIYPALSAAGLAKVPSRGRAAFMGWFAAAFNAGGAIVSLTLGSVADGFGYPIIFVSTGVLLLTGVVPLLRGKRRAALGHA